MADAKKPDNGHAPATEFSLSPDLGPARDKLRALRTDLSVHPAATARPKDAAATSKRTSPAASTAVRHAIWSSRLLAVVLVAAAAIAYGDPDDFKTYDAAGRLITNDLHYVVGAVASASAACALVGAIGLAVRRRWGWIAALTSSVGAAALGYIVLEVGVPWFSVPLLLVAVAALLVLTSRSLLVELVLPRRA